jgi:hypothetical protein
MCGFHAIVPVAGVDPLGEYVKARIVFGIGDFCRHKALVT